METERLLIRPWEERDLDAFAALNADAETMRFFPAPLTRDEVVALLDRIAPMTAEGLGFQAVEEKQTGELVGMVGMAPAPANFACAPAVEIGWRLAKHHWGKGYASEAARAWLAHGFDNLGLAEIVAFTYVGNTPSRRVMERLGMRREMHAVSESLHRNGEWLDGYTYALLASDWKPAEITN